MKTIILLLICLISQPLWAECKLNDYQKKAKLKEAAQKKIDSYGAFRRFTLVDIIEKGEGNYSAILRLKEVRCREIKFHMSMNDNCEILSSLTSIQGCSQ